MEQPNLSYLDELAGDDEEFRQQFIQILKTEYPVEQGSYLKLYDGEELVEAGLMVHKLKHKINVVGMHEAYTLATEHEEKLKNGDKALHSDFFRILETIDSFLKGL